MLRRQPLNSFQRKHRQELRGKILRNGLMISAFVSTAAFFYHFGEQQMAARMNMRMDEVSSLTTERDSLHKQVIDLQAATLVDRQKIAELDNRYRQDIPDDATRALLLAMREKIANGVTLERMTTLITAAANPRSCRNRETKRFMLSTPLNQGSDSTATFASGSVAVSGDGKTAKSADGRPEAWFDASQDVTMKFRLIGGRVSVANGTLPLTHSIINDQLEHRFMIEAGARGFVTVTADTCDYPETPRTVPPATAMPVTQ